MPAVRRSCQTMAWWTGVPVPRSHSTAVSRWLVMPIAAISVGGEAGRGDRLPADRQRVAPDVLGVVLDPAVLGEVLPQLLLPGADGPPVAVEHDGAAARGALVDREHVLPDRYGTPSPRSPPLASRSAPGPGCGRGTRRVSRCRLGRIRAATARRAKPRVAVIGAGPGGLAAALLLARAGAETVVFERGDAVGGRTRTLVTPEGYRFDLGPTFFLYPRILREIFAACGARLEDHVELKRLDPAYRLVFEGDGELDAAADPAGSRRRSRGWRPPTPRNLQAYLADNRAKLEAFEPVLARPFGRLGDLVSPAILRAFRFMRPFRPWTATCPLLRRPAHPARLLVPDQVPGHVAVPLPQPVHHPELPRARARGLPPDRRVRRRLRGDGGARPGLGRRVPPRDRGRPPRVRGRAAGRGRGRGRRCRSTPW